MPLSQISPQKKVCPRCGESYSYIEKISIGERSYLYAVHYYVDENGRRRKRRCYLGPVDGYEYVSKTHDITFYGLDRQDRYIRYLEEILRLLGSEVTVSTEVDEFKKVFLNIMRMRSLAKKIERRSEEYLEKIIQTMISDVKASIDVLKRDYPDNSQAIELVKEFSKLDEEIERTGLEKSYKIMNEEALKSYVERYLQLKQKLKQFNL